MIERILHYGLLITIGVSAYVVLTIDPSLAPAFKARVAELIPFTITVRPR